MGEWNARILFFILAAALYEEAAATDNRVPGARSGALSGAVAALPGAGSLFDNQAGLVYSEGVAFQLQYESLFGAATLPLVAAGAVVPTRYGTFGASLYQFGTAGYRELKTGLAYSKRLGKKLSASLQFDYFSLLFPENRKTAGAITFEAGVLAGTPGGRYWALHVFNPAKAGKERHPGKPELPWSVRCGHAWFPSSLVLVCLEAEKCGGHPVLIKTGVEFSPHRDFSLRAGVSGFPLKFSAGAGFRSGILLFDLAFRYHGNLGFTPSAGIVITPE